MRQVNRHDPGALREAPVATQPGDLVAERGQVEVGTAVVVRVSEGQLEEDQVVGACQLLVRKGRRVRGVQQDRVRAGHVEQQRGAVVHATARGGVRSREGADPHGPIGAVLPDNELIACRQRAELDGGLGPDPLAAALDRLGGPGHEQPRPARPRPCEQERRVEVVGVVVGDQHRAHAGQVDAARPGVRPGIDQQAAVHQCAGPVAMNAGVARPLAALARAPRVGPAVGASGAEEVDAHQRVGPTSVTGAATTTAGSNVGAASNAAIRLVRRNAASTRLPSSSTTVQVSAARGRS